MSSAAALRHPLAELFRDAARGCRRHGPTNAALLAAAADDLEAGGVTAAVMAGHERDRSGSVPGLRFAAAVHRLVLAGSAPELARQYATVGGRLDEATLWSDARPVLVEHLDRLRAIVAGTHVQTNEPGRSAPLYGGLLVAAQRAATSPSESMPVRLLEVGASAGLNLRPHRIGYHLGGSRVLGDPASRLLLDPRWTGLPPADLDRPLRLARRAGCDLEPVDVNDPDGVLHLSSFVWPDQPERLHRLRAAIRLARLDPVTVQRADGADWLEHRLARPRPGVLTVVWHSVVWQYVSASDRARGQQVLAAAAARATQEAPLALLVYESRHVPRGQSNAPYRFDLLLRLWPAGLTVCLGHGAGHGTPFTWHETAL
ncbi:MAG TPA: DUF2332 domain-containing protein [Pseudonocardiaceae bacterium]|jgi:hypothetical protein